MYNLFFFNGFCGNIFKSHFWMSFIRGGFSSLIERWNWHNLVDAWKKKKEKIWLYYIKHSKFWDRMPKNMVRIIFFQLILKNLKKKIKNNKNLLLSPLGGFPQSHRFRSWKTLYNDILRSKIRLVIKKLIKCNI